MNTTPQHLVYGLIDPRTNELRYIGKSSRGLVRPKQHCTQTGRKLNTHNGSWLKNMWADNETLPSVLILATCEDEKHALSQERVLIAKFRTTGFNLTNLTDGGEGTSGRVFSLETRALMSKQRMGNTNGLGREQSSETREKIGKAHIGNTHSLGVKRSEETRAKLSKSKMGNTYNLGRKTSPETCAKMSKALKGKGLGVKQSHEHIEKRRLSMIGRTFNLGRRHSPEAIEKIRAAHQGMKASPEAIVNMKLAWEKRRNKTKQNK